MQSMPRLRPWQLAMQRRPCRKEAEAKGQTIWRLVRPRVSYKQLPAEGRCSAAAKPAGTPRGFDHCARRHCYWQRTKWNVVPFSCSTFASRDRRCSRRTRHSGDYWESYYYCYYFTDTSRQYSTALHYHSIQQCGNEFRPAFGKCVSS